MLGYASGNKLVGEVCREQTSECRHGLTGQGARTNRTPSRPSRPPGRRRAVTPEQDEAVTQLVAQGATVQNIMERSASDGPGDLGEICDAIADLPASNDLGQFQVSLFLRRARSLPVDRQDRAVHGP